MRESNKGCLRLYNIYVILLYMKKYGKYTTLSEIKKEWMKEPEFKKAYNDLEVEFKLIELMIDCRLKKGVTQKQLAELVGTKQSSIARFESGNYNPTFAFVQKLATALGAKIKVEV